MQLFIHKLIKKNKALLPVLSFCFFLLTWAVAVNILPKQLSNLNYWYTPEFEEPNSDYFYTDAWGQEASHAVLYHDIGGSIKNARRADIIFIGNSRLPLGLREEFIVPLAKQAGLRVFSLGVGHGEAAEFARQVIRKHQLKPKILVVVGGPHLYVTWMSKLAEKVVSQSRWKSITEQLQTRGSWVIRSMLHTWMPKISFPKSPREANYLIYRSALTGWWHPVVEPSWQYDVSYDTSGNRFEGILPYVKKFKFEMDSQDTLMITAIVPYTNTSDMHLALLQQELGIPFINPKLNNLKTADGSHLHKQSAARLSHEFWEIFMNLPEVRQRLAKP